MLEVVAHVMRCFVLCCEPLVALGVAATFEDVLAILYMTCQFEKIACERMKKYIRMTKLGEGYHRPRTTFEACSRCYSMGTLYLLLCLCMRTSELT